mmetsp:Transcript_82070/g.129231  ORF Transcript_82070/g.129231 Transcript_82070/m.129231 type:complete len:291 (-) Transcript_82070:1308-2180(-)
MTIGVTEKLMMKEMWTAVVWIATRLRMDGEMKGEAEMLDAGIGILGGREATTSHAGRILRRAGMSRLIVPSIWQTRLGEESADATVQTTLEILAIMTKQMDRIGVKSMTMEATAPESTTADIAAMIEFVRIEDMMSVIGCTRTWIVDIIRTLADTIATTTSAGDMIKQRGVATKFAVEPPKTMAVVRFTAQDLITEARRVTIVIDLLMQSDVVKTIVVDMCLGITSILREDHSKICLDCASIAGDVMTNNEDLMIAISAERTPEREGADRAETMKICGMRKGRKRRESTL